MLPDGLSMLWERVEAGAALRERFGFTGFQDAAAWCTAVLAEHWGVRAHGCTRLAISDRNAILWVASSRGPVIVKWSAATDRFRRLEASTRLTRTLADHGAPVARPLPTQHGEDRLVLDGPSVPLSLAVLPELRGDWLDVADPAAVRSAGRELARLHRVLAEVPAEQALAADPVVALPDRILRWLDADRPDPAPAAARRLRALLDAAPRLEERPQLIHNDFRAANVLTTGSAVSAVLDFDEVRVADPLLDLAKAGVHLGTRFTDWRPTPPAARAAFFGGYESVGLLGAERLAWLEILVLWVGLEAIPGAHDPAAWTRAVLEPEA